MSSKKIIIKDNQNTAILVDGGFYRRRAYKLKGDLTPEERANELENYCKRFLNEKINGLNIRHDLYRIFYYDCLPSTKKIMNPFTKTTEDLSKTEMYSWTNEFLKQLKTKRKFALRLGKISDENAKYNITPDAFKKLCNKKIQFSDLKNSDLKIVNLNQKGVDMKIGLDIASLAYKKQVSQIILISGDADFVSAAKLARREGIDFVLDPLGNPIRPELNEHIDGLRSCDICYNNSKKIKEMKKG